MVRRSAAPARGGKYPDIGTPWRWDVGRALDRLARRDALVDGDIYEFGVFTGGSLRVMRSAWAKYNLTGKVGGIWGFDSFIGLGDEDSAGVSVNSNDAEKSWTPGAYSASTALNIRSFAALQSKILEHISGTEEYARDPFGGKVKFHRGFFNVSLTDTLAASQGMAPAMYVDIDVDHYLPSRQALFWLLRSKLIRVGTLVGYDDFGNTDMWTAGESRAHRQVAEAFGIDFRLVSSECMASAANPAPQPGKHGSSCAKIPAAGCGRNFHPIFRVEALGGVPRLC